MLRAGQHRRGVRVGQDLRQPGRRLGGSSGRYAAPALKTASIAARPRRPCARTGCRRSRRSAPRCAQAPGQPLRARVELRVAEPPLAVVERGRVRPAPRHCARSAVSSRSQAKSRSVAWKLASSARSCGRAAPARRPRRRGGPARRPAGSRSLRRSGPRGRVEQVGRVLHRAAVLVATASRVSIRSNLETPRSTTRSVSPPAPKAPRRGVVSNENPTCTSGSGWGRARAPARRQQLERHCWCANSSSVRSRTLASSAAKLVAGAQAGAQRERADEHPDRPLQLGQGRFAPGVPISRLVAPGQAPPRRPRRRRGGPMNGGRAARARSWTAAARPARSGSGAARRGTTARRARPVGGSSSTRGASPSSARQKASSAAARSPLRVSRCQRA